MDKDMKEKIKKLIELDENFLKKEEYRGKRTEDEIKGFRDAFDFQLSRLRALLGIKVENKNKKEKVITLTEKGRKTIRTDNGKVIKDDFYTYDEEAVGLFIRETGVTILRQDLTNEEKLKEMLELAGDNFK